MAGKDNNLTAQEMQLLALYRELDTRRQAQLVKAAQALRACDRPNKYAF